ncbi:conserved hypothetical protein [Desulfosudis oleivorans Hxd3]|uniref:DUF1573 domain-containing protein n=2 Tax=Desulfosudis TaxID=2904716 RepID=A8ZRR6_DESOH|nr:conserved hypothetical protein [Desulfosudis oleivorans Hxd3]
MKRLIMLSGMVLFLLSAGAVVFAADVPDKASPVAVIEARTFTFDPVPEGTEVVHDFTVKNTGTAELRVEQVKTG